MQRQAMPLSCFCEVQGSMHSIAMHAQYSNAQLHSIAMHAQYSNAQYSNAQYSNAQYSNAQYSNVCKVRQS